MEASPSPDRSRAEWLAVTALSAIGLGLRCWPIGRLGLTHFDEGIYALVASWSLLPKGLAGIDPSLIPYAPPGYPILGGLAYLVLGRSDGSMIAVSQVAGTLTIPVVAWLGRRTFGPGAGFTSAAFCAFSGPHVAFSRMALTDAAFLLAWLLAIGAGMRFLERPGAIRAIVMGLAVGLAQEFKYNGWLAGGIVIATALLGIAICPKGRRPGPILQTFGWGGLAAGVAWLVVWPWYSFVEGQGGYSALLRHQRSYLGGFRDWWPNFLIQAEQALAMSGWLWPAPLILALLTPWFVGPRRPLGLDGQPPSGRHRLSSYLAPIWLCPFAVFVVAPYWLGLISAPCLLTWPRPAVRLVGIYWLLFTVISPFYHPYARLWLPYHACNWLLMGLVIANVFTPILAGRSHPSMMARDPDPGKSRGAGPFLVVAGLFTLGLVPFSTTCLRRASPQPGLLAPSDSLYLASRRVAEALPDHVKVLRLLGRPPLTYYLAGRILLAPMAGSDSLLGPGSPDAWALIDSAILRSEAGYVPGAWQRDGLGRFAERWEVVDVFPTMPSLPTLLDLDPDAARSSAGDRSYPLWLLRPRTPKAPR